MRPSPLSIAVAIALAAAVSPSLHAAAATQLAAHSPAVSAIEAARGDPSRIILPLGIFDPLQEVIDAQAVGVGGQVSSRYAIVQFDPGATARRGDLEARGVEFLGYIPNNAYYVRLNGYPLERLQQDEVVRWAGPLRAEHRLDPSLWQARRMASAARQWTGYYEIQIDLFAGESSERIARALRKQVPGVGVTARSERAGAAPWVRAQIESSHFAVLLEAATSLDGVAFVSPWVQPEPMNAGAIGAIQGDATGSCAGSGAVCGPTPMWDQGLFGRGQIVAVADSGTDANEAWFTSLDKGPGPHEEVTFADDPPPELPGIGLLHPDNKIIGYWVQPGATAYDSNQRCSPGSSPISWHGTHVSGTVLGDAAGTFGASSYAASTPTAANHELADGMAPNAQLLMQDIGNDVSGCLAINDLRGTLLQALAADAHIHSNSWGASTAGNYGGNDNNVDYVSNVEEDLLFIVAAGNSGSSARTTGSPGNAKNALTVGALSHAGAVGVAYFSSRGPTADGRIKPDIMAPGSSTISARGDSSTNGTIEAPASTSMSGTSMATPTIAGNAALMRQYFTDGFYPRGERTAADTYNPSGMAMKAFLLNGTNPLQPTSWPNNNIGWGRAWLDGNLWFASTQPGGDDSRRARLFERTNAAGLETGEVHEYVIENLAAGEELRATLTWFDPEASVGAASTLVNDLDLEVVAPDATVYLGNVFSGGQSSAGGSADNKNTVEQVRLPTPVAGSYTLRVKGSAIPGNGRAETDRQGYALVVSGAFGLPDLPAFEAPTTLSAVGNDATGVQLGFAAEAGAQGFQLYRADGSCSAARPGDFRMVAGGEVSPLLDARTQGGFSYAYRVRGVSNDVEGEASDCLDLVSEAGCTLQPMFETTSLSTDGRNAGCSVALAWDPATARCPTSSEIEYAVERADDPYFNSSQVIASGLADAEHLDVGVVDGTPYYYRVTARDSFGNAAPVSVIRNVTPSGQNGPNPGAFLDDVDTHTYMRMELPWQITNTSASSGSYSYHNAPDGQPYPDLTCASITLPPLELGPASSLSFKARYDLEHEWDGVVMEISTDGGLSWNDLPPDGGYPGSYAQTMDPPINACGYPNTQGSFTGVSTAGNNADPNNGSATAVFKPFERDLSDYAGQTVQIRWRMSTDPAAGYLGFLLDEVRVTDPELVGTAIFASGFEDGEEPGVDYACH